MRATSDKISEMSERKSLNKYLKPDSQYNKNIIPKKKKWNSIRFMTPFTIFCLVCQGVIVEGIKINAFKEKIISENYVRTPIFRFYLKCLFCSTAITIKTDPKNSRYMPEINCKKIFKIRKNNKFG